MISKETIKTIIADNQELPLPTIWKRTLEIPLNSGKIVTLTGVRRSGKTYHLFTIIQKLITLGVDPKKILYFNFEDERLDIKTLEPDLILQSYRELYPNLNLSQSYFLFDEIQELPNWEKFTIRIYNSVSRHVFVTGSNATLLSKEIATSLRGRTVTFEVFPLSFPEFVNIKKSGIKKPESSKNRAILASLFEEFMLWGGFPEIITQKKTLRGKILQEYFNVMVLRDLVERYKISEPVILKYFCKRAVGNSGCEFSVNKIYNEIKSQGYKISKDSLYAYQDYMESVYLIRFLPKYAQSVIKREMSRKKSYIIDQGLGSALDAKLAQDKSRLLETTAALEFIKRGKDIGYNQNHNECDFIISAKGSVEKAIQVTYDFDNQNTKEREIKGLVQTCEKFGLKEGTIITLDKEDNFKEGGINVKVVPAWKYFLN
ncbi:MAG: ATP-binding protein [bacterium]